MLRTIIRSSLVNQSVISNQLKLQHTSKMTLLTISNSINESLKKNEIFNDVLDEFKPNGLLTIAYEGESNEVALGNTLKVSETQQVPKFQFTLSSDPSILKDSDLFTLVLTDPDAPSRTDKKWSEYAHYIKTNISLKNPSTTSSEAETFISSELNSNGDEYLKYEGPGPPKGTGKHRYVFLLFKQLNGHLSAKPLEGRPNWGYGIPATGVKRWASENSLEPWAVNFFQAELK